MSDPALRRRDPVREAPMASPELGQDLEQGSSTYPPNGTLSNHTTIVEPSASQKTLPTRKATGETLGSRRRTFTSLLQPERPVGKAPTYKQSFIATVKASWLNLLLVCVPISFALHFAKVNGVAVFVVSFFAIIPLAKLLGFATEEIAIRVGPTLGGLINATLGNAVELIVAILALVKCELVIVQASLLGSILSNLLLVLGCCFIAGGLRYSEVGFSNASAQVNAPLLVVAVMMILIPTGFHATYSGDLSDEVERKDILKLSRGTAVIVLVMYGLYLLFQLYTHSHLYEEHGTGLAPEEGKKGVGSHRMFKPARSVGGKAVRERIAAQHKEDQEEYDEVEEEIPQLNFPACCILLIAVTVLVGFVAEWLVDSINEVTASGNISATWVGLILLPIVGNAAEHVTAVTVAYKDKLDLAIGVAVGSSIQVALLVIPFLVVLAWIMDKPLSLLFDPFESIVLFLSVLIVNYTTQDGRANWLEGAILVLTYFIIAVCVWFLPTANDASDLFEAVCHH